jgi:hypothetical protein
VRGAPLLFLDVRVHADESSFLALAEWPRARWNSVKGNNSAMITNNAGMIRGSSRWSFKLAARAAFALALLSPSAPALADVLKERPMEALKVVGPRASVVSSTWIELTLPEVEYDAATVGDASRYVIMSVDDADFKDVVAPSTVHHRHFPESAPYAGGMKDPFKIEVTYRIFLELPEGSSLKEGKKYSVSVDESVGIQGPFQFTFHKDKPNEAIHVNQVAYLADGPKIAYMSAWTGQGSIDFGSAPGFQLIDEVSGEVVFNGEIKLDVTADQEKWSGSNVYSLDFSSFNGEGRYHVYVPTVGSSFPFGITAGAFHDIGYTVIRGLTLHRDGDHGLDSPSITNWHRPPAHLDDAIVESTGKRVDLVGGHMDAGDRGKYFHNVADVSAAMLSAMALFPDQIELLGESLQIPESGNGIPDFIDETVYELDFLRKAVMNTPKDGTLPFFLRPQKQDGGGGYEMGHPPEGKKDRKLYDVSMGPRRAETLYAAGALAMASNNELLKKYAPEKCAAYLEAAKRAFSGFVQHHNDPGYFKVDKGNDANKFGWYDVWTAGPNPWSDEMLVAASNLYEATGDEAYLKWLAEALPTDLGATKRWGWDSGGPWLPAFLSLSSSSKLEAEMPGINARALAAIDSWVTTEYDEKPADAPFGAPLPWAAGEGSKVNIGWHFSSEQVTFPMMVAYGVTKDPKYRDTLIKTWSWLLGANPQSRSFYSGLGDPSRSPRWSVHEIAHYQYLAQANGEVGWTELPPGIPSADVQQGVYDNAYIKDPHNKARKDKKFPAADQHPVLYRFHDSWTVKNEFTINKVARGAASLIPLISLPVVEPPPVVDPPPPEPVTTSASFEDAVAPPGSCSCRLESGITPELPATLASLAAAGLFLRLRRRPRRLL